ncbi:xanthine dehydrogenase YagT iron-sulfur-binding subunit [Dyadobacter sp. SG02]|uniref:(2Fe-2S)-binding protein n=1 Tax=Dyadobacter sp. SG02 TaxID=1855291 RepID=UPI0008AF1D01|nr:(2Fe-2S)-binding protein [Dyadobacter sp. SG02]SEJ04227.1 xanthine dehydrogenase YagT iron-sulfur-binding subunit [Dyadobacter sp. SG02]
MDTDHDAIPPDAPDEDRRFFLKQSMFIAGLSMAPADFLQTAQALEDAPTGNAVKVRLSLTINGKRRRISIDPRMTLLDLLRENLGLTGTKKGCDFGQCGACTVHIDGRRTLSCLTFAVMQHGAKVTTIEGLSEGEKLHPLQEAFIKHDGFQCGYCTPGQVMSGVACIREGHAGSAEEVREYMSGNLCRCGAYPNIVDAILEVKKEGSKV